MPPRRARVPGAAPELNVVQREQRVQALYQRIAHPAPPHQPELFDQDFARHILRLANWDVDVAETGFRAYRLRMRRETATAAANPTPTPTPTQPAAATSTPSATGDQATAESGNHSDSNAQGEASEHKNQPNASSQIQGEGDVRPPFSPDGQLLYSMAISLLPESVGEQQRRDAVVAFHMEVEERFNVNLSIAEAVLLLQLEDFDIPAALAVFSGHEAARRRLRFEFDGLRKFKVVNDKIQESKCLQIMTEITGRPDRLSLRKAMGRVEWNLIRAVTRWFKNGISVYTKRDLPKWKKMPWGCRMDRWGRRLKRPSPDSTIPAGDIDYSTWTRDTGTFSNAPGPDNEDPEPAIHGEEWRKHMAELAKAPAARDRKRRNVLYNRQEGFIVDDQYRNLKSRAAVSPSDFLIEWYHNNKYWYKIFKKGYLDMGEPEPCSSSSSSSSSSPSSGGAPGDSAPHSNKSSSVDTGILSDSPPANPPQPRVPFDPNNTAHRTALNKWHTTTRGEVGILKRSIGLQIWSPEELDWLYARQLEIYTSFKRTYPRTPRRDLLHHVIIPDALKDQWEAAFNRRFVGTICSNDQYPRQPRRAGAIVQQRTRYLKLATHFRITLHDETAKKVRKSKTLRAELRGYKAERDRMEADDERETQRYVDANPVNDPALEKVVEKMSGRRKRQATSSAEPSSGDGSGNNGGNGDDDGNGNGGGSENSRGGGNSNGNGDGGRGGAGGRGRGRGRGRGARGH